MKKSYLRLALLLTCVTNNFCTEVPGVGAAKACMERGVTLPSLLEEHIVMPDDLGEYITKGVAFVVNGPHTRNDKGFTHFGFFINYLLTDDQESTQTMKQEVREFIQLHSKSSNTRVREALFALAITLSKENEIRQKYGIPANPSVPTNDPLCNRDLYNLDAAEDKDENYGMHWHFCALL